MIKKLSSSILLGFLSMMLLFSCSVEDKETGLNSNNQSVEKVKNWFENNSNSLNLKIIQYTKEIEWDKAIITNGENGQIIEIPITLKDFIATTSTTDKKQKNYHRLLFTKNQDETYNCFDLQIITSEADFDNLDQNFNYYNIKKDFNGYVTLFDPKKGNVDYLKFKNGEITKPSITGKSDSMADTTCTYLVWIYEDGHMDIITQLYCEGGGISGGGSEGAAGGYGGAAGGGGNVGSNYPPSPAEIIVEKIDDTQLDDCPEAIMQQLKNPSFYGIKQVLDKLNVGFTYNVTMKMGKMKYDGDYAETSKISKNNYLITVSPDYDSATTLYRAHSLLHELTHAYFISLYDDYNTYPTNAPFADYPELYKLYVEKSLSKDNVSLIEHEDMAKSYVNLIARALQEYDTGHDVPFAGPSQVYTDMAWYGINNTEAFKKLSEEDKFRMENRFKAEQNGVYSKGQWAIGKKCN